MISIELLLIRAIFIGNTFDLNTDWPKPVSVLSIEDVKRPWNRFFNDRVPPICLNACWHDFSDRMCAKHHSWEPIIIGNVGKQKSTSFDNLDYLASRIVVEPWLLVFSAISLDSERARNLRSSFESDKWFPRVDTFTNTKENCPLPPIEAFKLLLSRNRRWRLQQRLHGQLYTKKIPLTILQTFNLFEMPWKKEMTIQKSKRCKRFSL